MKNKTRSTSPSSRMAGKFTIDIATGCHQWTASRSTQGKYPTIGEQAGNKPVYAYRVAWEVVNGPMPTTPPPDGSDRWELHHNCHNKECVNPAHIELLTRKEHQEAHRREREARYDARITWAAGLVRQGWSNQRVKEIGLPEYIVKQVRRAVNATLPIAA